MSYHSQEKVQIFNLVYQLFYFHCYKKKVLHKKELLRMAYFRLH